MLRSLDTGPDRRYRLTRLLQDIWERSTAATARIPRGQSPTGSMRLQFLLGEWDQVESWARSTTGQATLGLGRLAAVRLLAELARLRAQTDPHSLPRFRVDGVVSNMPEFQEAFACPATAPMVRGDKACRVW